MEFQDGEKVLFMIEASTSKATVLKDLVKKTGELINLLPPESKKRNVITICVGRRFDIISVLQNELSSTLRNHRTFIVQCTAADTQGKRSLPTFRLVCQSEGCSEEKLPCAAQVNAVRSKAWEGLRQRCMSTACPFRAKLETDAGTDSEKETEEAGELFEAAEESSDEENAPVSSRAPCVPASKGYIKELWPYARPVQQGVKIMQQLLHSETATRLILLTRTAHPGLLVAARQVKLRAIAYVEAPDHQYKHGQHLLEQMLVRTKYPEAKAAIAAANGEHKKRARGDDLQFRSVQAPPMTDQIIEFQDVAAEAASSWRGGLDLLVQDINEKCAALLKTELEENHLALVSTALGKSLRAEKSFRHDGCCQDLAILTVRLSYGFCKGAPDNMHYGSN